MVHASRTAEVAVAACASVVVVHGTVCAVDTLDHGVVEEEGVGDVTGEVSVAVVAGVEDGTVPVVDAVNMTVAKPPAAVEGRRREEERQLEEEEEEEVRSSSRGDSRCGRHRLNREP